MEFKPPQNAGSKIVLPPSPLGAPSPQQQSWGAVASIIIILHMVVIGAFYAWGKRIAEERALIQQTASTTQTY